ncbi:MAG: T9SS type A sorting domain-containing protein [Candidatus Latescibacterota bacterium]|nr:MAG: T9SS type A sorting domain-containing protein [Candidatus Latescibacterota bacterium]
MRTLQSIAGWVSPLVLAVAVAHADLPAEWEVEVFAGRIHDIATGGGIVACATDGGFLLYEPATGDFGQVVDAGCRDGDCLRSNRLTAVSRDAQGRYWVGTLRSGVTALSPIPGGLQYSHFFTENDTAGGALLSDSVRAIFAFEDETVYVGTSRGVAQIDLAGAFGEYNDLASRRRGEDGFPNADVHDVAADATHVWVATDSGVVRYERLQPLALEVLSDSLEGGSTAVVEIVGGDVYAGTDVGVHVWDDAAGHWRRIRNTSATPTPDFEVLSLALDPSADPPRIAVGSQLEVWYFNGFVWGPCSPATLPLLEQRIFSAVAAVGDTLWTSQGNINGEGAFLERTTFGNCSWERIAPNSIPPSELRFVDYDRMRGDLWIGTGFAGIARRAADGTWCVFNGNDPDVAANMSDPAGRVSAFRVDRSGAVWFTFLPIEAQAPVDRLVADPNCVHGLDVWRHIRPGQGGFGGRYWRIEEDGSGNRFFLADGDPAGPGGVDLLSADTLQVANVRADLIGGSGVGALEFERRSGAWTFAWLGVNNRGDQGLIRWINSDDLFNPTSSNFTILPLTRLGGGGNLEVNSYRALAYDASRGELWAGTDNGIFRYDVGRGVVDLELRKKQDAAPGLLSPDVRDLLLDDRNNLWIATADGLNRIALPAPAAKESLTVDAFSTREKIEELNAGVPIEVGILYLLERTLAPLPGPEVGSLAYDASQDLLQIGTGSGLATLDVERLDARVSIPIERAVVFPNPVRAFDDPTEIFLADVSVPANVMIYNLEGELVHSTLITDLAVPVWDLRIFVNRSGQGSSFFNAASGIYMVRVENDTGTKVAPLVVIR